MQDMHTSSWLQAIGNMVQVRSQEVEKQNGQHLSRQRSSRELASLRPISGGERMKDLYERIFLTVRYACGHDMLRTVFRIRHGESDVRSIGDTGLCRHCKARDSRAYDLKMEKAGKL
jgi:hypothetical protein